MLAYVYYTLTVLMRCSIDWFFFQECAAAGGTCHTTIDGYYLECLICLLYGVVWYYWGKSKIRSLQRLPMTAWRVVKTAKAKR